MTIKEFIKKFTDKKISNNKINEHAVSDYLKKELEIKTYVPFREKRKIAEMIVEHNISEVDGVKKYDSINGYVDLIVSSVLAHTNLKFSSDPVEDYDLLAESGLLPQIIAEFQSSHNEIDVVLKMALAMELEDNNVNSLIGRFLNKISKGLDSILETTKDKLGGTDWQSALGFDFNEEDLALLKGFLNKFR